jgi:hypothetical protein
MGKEPDEENCACSVFRQKKKSTVEAEASTVDSGV